MRWDNLRLTDAGDDDSAMPLFARGAVARTFDTPEFKGMTFYEIHARSIINKVPAASRVPFSYTINPYRGCSHSCTYCLVGDTPVLMADGTTKPIADLRPGDLIIGTAERDGYRRYVTTKVLDHWSTIKPAYRITLADGTTLVASGDHRFLTTGDRGWRHVTRGSVCARLDADDERGATTDALPNGDGGHRHAGADDDPSRVAPSDSKGPPATVDAGPRYASPTTGGDRHATLDDGQSRVSPISTEEPRTTIDDRQSHVTPTDGGDQHATLDDDQNHVSSISTGGPRTTVDDRQSHVTPTGGGDRHATLDDGQNHAPPIGGEGCPASAGDPPCRVSPISDGDGHTSDGDGPRHVSSASGGKRLSTADDAGRVGAGGVRPALTTDDRLVGVGRFAEPPKRDEDYELGYLAAMGCVARRPEGHEEPTAGEGTTAGEGVAPNEGAATESRVKTVTGDTATAAAGGAITTAAFRTATTAAPPTAVAGSRIRMAVARTDETAATDGAEQHTAEQHTAEQHTAEQHRTGQPGAGQPRTEQPRTEQHGAVAGSEEVPEGASERTAGSAVAESTRFPSREWAKGFLAGAFDRHGPGLGLDDRDVRDHGGGDRGDRDGGDGDDGGRLIRRCLGELGLTPPTVGDTAGRLRFFHTVAPATAWEPDLDGVAVTTAEGLRVRSVEPLGVDLPMFDITTGTGDFIADGVVSHNCFARKTHEYLDLDAGHDFDSKIVVKVNAAELARKELAAPRWSGDHIAMGTNVDCYQRAEGRYQLMPGILRALGEAANPFSVLTKGTLILRDLPLLVQAARVTEVSAAVSVGFLDEGLWRAVEPGTPNPRRRLEVCRRLNDSGIACGVLMAPILPYLSDAPEQLAETVGQIAAAGATHVSPIVLHLRPGAREWFLGWLSREHPRLVPRYLELYGRGAYAPKAYQDKVTAHVRHLAEHFGIGRSPSWRISPDKPPQPEQLSLL
ncbi:Rv2578c family radical SAM protein [Nonomuraea sp. NPDC059194]|uniref:Rv2578c family radical SAM protein n=1 Tax=Nonomuraea sp. NPDC059194 TaxID=3346764 RepID=UPI0036AD21B9